MKKTIVSVILFLVFGAVVSSAAEFKIYERSSYMDWTENYFNPRRNPFVRENGFLNSLGGNVAFSPWKNFYLQSEGEIFYGNLNYSGGTISTGENLEKEADWKGFRLAETLGYEFHIPVHEISIMPFVSLEYSSWHRGSCGEAWNYVFSKLGLRLDKKNFFAEIGANFPFYTKVDGKWGGIAWVNGGRETDVVVHPKGRPSPFAEVGFRHKSFIVSLSYEVRKWDESEKINLGGGVSALQPETAQSLVGVKIGYKF